MTTTVSTTSELKEAVANAGAGSEIIARGGTYEMSSRWTITSGGASDNPLTIRAAEGEEPQIRFAAGGRQKRDSGIQFRSPYVTFRGFEIAGSGWKGVNTDGNAHDVIFEDLEVHGGNLWGVMNNGCDNVVFRNCDSYDNFDPQNGGDNSDGFNMTGPAQNGLIEGCRAWNNGDDGYDMWVSENHTIRNCWAWENGRGDSGDGNGFKLGGGPNRGGGHLVHHCVAYNNGYRGFDWNTTDRQLEVYNCTASDNQINYRFNESGPYTLRNNISNNGRVVLDSGVDDQYNSWNLDIEDPGFLSTDPSSDEFLHLSSSSPCTNAGVDVGLSFDGDAPSLGAFESVSQSEKTGSRTTLDGEITLAAADATTDSLFQTEHSGFTNEGYVNFVEESGSIATWEIEVPEPGQYDLEIRYANGGDLDRTANITYAGTQHQVTFPQTGGWTEWSTITDSLQFPSGPIDLTVETTGQDAGNIDRITLWPVEETDGNKESGDTPNHGYATPEPGQEDWHVPLNENFEAIDRGVPVVDEDGAKDQYDPAERTVYIAMDTGVVYVGNGSQWNQLGRLS